MIARFHRHLDLRPIGRERITLAQSLNRVLAESVIAEVDVPGFDRASVDGFAVRADDTLQASADTKAIAVERGDSHAGTAAAFARDARVGDFDRNRRHAAARCQCGGDGRAQRDLQQDGTTLVELHRPATPGQFIAFAGSDLARGETVVRAGEVMTSREIGMLAAVGCTSVVVCRRPRVAILSTGDEILPPGQPMRPGAVYDSNAAILAAAVEEVGGVPERLGIGPDSEEALRDLIEQGLASCDVVVVSGGTSKGAGDLCYRAVARFTDPGVLVHGVALKPGKPVCLAVTAGKALVVLPGFPTSAIFTFHEFVAPVIRAFAGLPPDVTERVEARLPLRVSSERGRTEFMMVSLVGRGNDVGFAAYPIGKGSGSVTSFSQADGFIAIDRHVESVAAETTVSVQMIGRSRRLAAL